MPGSYAFPRRARLSKDREYQRVFAARMRRSAGALTLHALPNNLPHHRLGLSVGRRAGSAVARNHAKRLIREAFRLDRPDLPRTDAGAYDLVVSLRAPLALNLDSLRSTLLRLAREAHDSWIARGAPP